MRKLRLLVGIVGPTLRIFGKNIGEFPKMSAAGISFSTHDTLLFRKKQSRLFRTEIGVGGWLQSLQVGEQVGNILFAWFFPEHRRGNTLAHGGGQIRLPTVPGLLSPLYGLEVIIFVSVIPYLSKMWWPVRLINSSCRQIPLPFLHQKNIQVSSLRLSYKIEIKQ